MLRASRVRGMQHNRDFELGKQYLRLFSPSGKTGEMDLDGAIAYSYPDTNLLVCVQANFQGLGLSGSYQNARRLTLLFWTLAAVGRTVQS